MIRLNIATSAKLQIVLLFAAVLPGCGSVTIYNVTELPSVRGVIPNSSLAVQNHKALTEAPKYPALSNAESEKYVSPDAPPLKAEWQFNRGTHPDAKDRPPRSCLALSGGGLRSAVFSIGVMKGLHEADVLKQVDVMSAVSGGGYAMSWYVAQKYWAHKRADGSTLEDTELFAYDKKYQQHLLENKKLVHGVARSVASCPEHISGFFIESGGKWHLGPASEHGAYIQRLQRAPARGVSQRTRRQA